MFAPPAAGKGTQSARICKLYHIPHISTGDLLRDVCREDTDMGRMIKKQMEIGSLIDDEIMIHLLKERLNKTDCQNGYILDGFPRNKMQAQLYEEMLHDLHKKIDLVILLDLDYETAKNRITGRMLCPNCKHVFNFKIDALKPKVEGVCDICQSKLMKRSDDNEKVFDHRYETYQNETEPLIFYYQDKYPFYKVDSTKSVDVVFMQIKQILERNMI